MFLSNLFLPIKEKCGLCFGNTFIHKVILQTRCTSKMHIKTLYFHTSQKQHWRQYNQSKSDEYIFQYNYTCVPDCMHITQSLLLFFKVTQYYSSLSFYMICTTLKDLKTMAVFYYSFTLTFSHHHVISDDVQFLLWNIVICFVTQ